MAEIKYTIFGDPRTKKNSSQIFYKGSRCPVCKKGRIPFVSPSEAFKKYEALALQQLRPIPPRPIECAVNVKCLYYMKTNREVDLNNLLEATCDILKVGKVLKDDNSKIVAAHDGSRVFHDKENPRVEIYITKMPTNEQLRMKGI